MRSRLLAAPEALADYEVLEMLLFLGIPRRDTKPQAKALILRFGSLADVLTAPDGALQQAGLNAESIGALQMVAGAARLLSAADAVDRPVLNNFDRLIAYLDPASRSEGPAKLTALYLNNRNQLLNEQSWPADDWGEALPRHVAQRALALHATALMLVFCRPASEATPSRPDIALGRQIAAAVELLSIVLHDSVIIGRGGDWLSLRQSGHF